MKLLETETSDVDFADSDLRDRKSKNQAPSITIYHFKSDAC